MNLDDYISNREKEKNEYISEVNNLRRWVVTINNIDVYGFIPKEKVSLIKEFGKHITSYQNQSVQLLDYVCDVKKYVFLQVKTTDNNSMLAIIERKQACYKNSELLDSVTINEETYNRYLIDRTPGISEFRRELEDEEISKEEYYRRLKQFQQVGSQKFASLFLKKSNSSSFFHYFESEKNNYVYYSSDGNVFMVESLADYLTNHISTDDLGNYLADQAIKIKQRKYPYNN